MTLTSSAYGHCPELVMGPELVVKGLGGDGSFAGQLLTWDNSVLRSLALSLKNE